MHSFRTKFTLLTIFVVIFAVSTVSLTSVFFIRNNEQRKSDQLLLLLCETGEKNLDYYFNDVQKSVKKVASFVEADLGGSEGGALAAHTERVRKYFAEMAYKTNGVLTFYYRISPEVSDTVKGFWYTNLDGEDFVEHKVTDITKYDTSDTTKLVWYTVPKNEGKAIWLPPYITDNLNKRVISYNVPVYRRGEFVGVVGIEIDYRIMAEQVNSIRLYNSGYAFLSDSEGNLFYHPYIDVPKLTEETKPEIPDGAVSESTFLKYRFNGVDKVAAWLPLSNGMRLVVTTPATEAEGEWQKLVLNIVITAAEVLTAAILFALFFSKRFAKPLKQLTAAAEQVADGDYDISLSYNKDDEIGILTKTFLQLADHMKRHIDELNNRVFVDELTGVGNKAAYADACAELQKAVNQDPVSIKFAIGLFDCNKLKYINDRFGHDKGDRFLQCASAAISKAFGCPVYRVGGDEFAVILRNDDYLNRELLIERFNELKERKNASNEKAWEKIDIAMGFAEYDEANDDSVDDVNRRADRKMYENKLNDSVGRGST